MLKDRNTKRMDGQDGRSDQIAKSACKNSGDFGREKQNNPPALR